MLFIYPNGPSRLTRICFAVCSTCPLSSFPLTEKKKKRSKHTHTHTHTCTRHFLFVRSLKRTQNVVGWIGYMYLLLCVACRQGICYLFMFFPSSFKFIIRLSSLCKSLLVFLFSCQVLFHFTMARNEKRKMRRHEMRCTEHWMQKQKKKENDISLAPDYRIEIILFLLSMFLFACFVCSLFTLFRSRYGLGFYVRLFGFQCQAGS